VERGSHHDLLVAEGRYAELYHTQFDETPQVSVVPTPKFSLVTEHPGTSL